MYTDVDVMFWSTFDPCTVDRPAVIALTPEVNHRGDEFNTFNSGVMLMNISVRPVCSLVFKALWVVVCWSAATLAAFVRGYRARWPWSGARDYRQPAVVLLRTSVCYLLQKCWGTVIGSRSVACSGSKLRNDLN